MNYEILCAGIKTYELLWQSMSRLVKHAVSSDGLLSGMCFREKQSVQNYLQARTTCKVRPVFSLSIIRYALSNWYDPSKFINNNSLRFNP